MKRANAALFSLLMIVSSLAGCIGGEEVDTTDLEQQIADLQQLNDEMNETINYQSGQIGMWYELNRDTQEQLEILDSMLETANNSIVDLQSTITDAETYRDSLLVLLENSNTSNDELESMIETANNSVLALQSDLVVQQDLVVQWQQTAEDNRAYLVDANLSGADLSDADLSNAYLHRAFLADANLSYADLSGADLSHANLDFADLRFADLSNADLSNAELYNLAWHGGVIWENTTCPDGSNSNDNGNTCVNHF